MKFKLKKIVIKRKSKQNIEENSPVTVNFQELNFDNLKIISFQKQTSCLLKFF